MSSRYSSSSARQPFIPSPKFPRAENLQGLCIHYQIDVEIGQPRQDGPVFVRFLIPPSAMAPRLQRDLEGIIGCSLGPASKGVLFHHDTEADLITAVRAIDEHYAKTASTGRY